MMTDQKPTALVVEDDAFIADLVAQKMCELFEVSIAESIVRAQTLTKENHYDVILLDVHLPPDNGIDFLRSLREKDQYKNIPVIILSNDQEDAEIQEAMDAGAQDYFIKSTADFSKVAEKAIMLIEQKTT